MVSLDQLGTLVPPFVASICLTASKSGKILTSRDHALLPGDSRRASTHTAEYIQLRPIYVGWRTERRGGQEHDGPLLRASIAPGRSDMLYTIAVVLILLWALGLVSSYTIGGFIHVLLVIAIVVILLRLISGRNPV